MVKRTKFRNFSGGLHLKKISWGKGFLRLMMLAALIATLGLVASPVAPVSAGGDWYDPDWQYRQEITIDHDRVGTMSALTANASSETTLVIVRDASRFSADDYVVIMDDSNNETCQVYFSDEGTNELEMFYPLEHDYTTTAHARVKNVSTSTNLTNFPVLVQITDQDNPIFIHAQTDKKAGEDILFTASNGITKLSHEIDWYSKADKELYAWVKVPILSTFEDTILYMYYGNVDYGKPGWLSPEDAENVWSQDYVMVQHLQESSPEGDYTPGVTYDDHLDSTSNDNDGEVFADNSRRVEAITVLKNASEAVALADPPNKYPEIVVFSLQGWNFVYYSEVADWNWGEEEQELTIVEEGGMDFTHDTECYFAYTYPVPAYPAPGNNTGAIMDYEGKIGLADYFDGNDDFIDCGIKDSISNITEEITVEAWVKLDPDRRGRESEIYEEDDPDYAAASSEAWEMCIWSGNGPPYGYDFYNDAWFSISGTVSDAYATATPIPLGEWTYVVITFDGTDTYSYVNCDFDATTAAPGSIDAVPGKSTFIGLSTDLFEGLKGTIDEVRISNVARDAGWFSTSYSNQAYPDLFYSLGTEEEYGVYPVAAEAGGPYSGIAGSSVSLNGSATGGTQPYSYAWDLDENDTYETPGKDVNHTWDTAGNYTVGLEVTDAANATATDTADVNISAAAFDPWVYDMNESGVIEIGELLDAISDYIGGTITISQLLEVIGLYITG